LLEGRSTFDRNKRKVASEETIPVPKGRVSKGAREYVEKNQTMNFHLGGGEKGRSDFFSTKKKGSGIKRIDDSRVEEPTRKANLLQQRRGYWTTEEKTV